MQTPSPWLPLQRGFLATQERCAEKREVGQAHLNCVLLQQGKELFLWLSPAQCPCVPPVFPHHHEVPCASVGECQHRSPWGSQWCCMEPQKPRAGSEGLAAVGLRMGRCVALRSDITDGTSGARAEQLWCCLAPRHPVQLKSNLVSSCRGRLW